MEIKKVIKKLPIQKVDFEEREVDVYVTEDGKEFSNEETALKYEENLFWKEKRRCYDNIEKLYVDMQYIPDYEYFQILKVKNAEEAKLVLSIMRNDVDNSINIDSMKFPNMIIISSYWDRDRDGYYHNFEKIRDLIYEYQPFVNFYNRMLEIKKEYGLGDDQYE